MLAFNTTGVLYAVENLLSWIVLYLTTLYIMMSSNDDTHGDETLGLKLEKKINFILWEISKKKSNEIECCEQLAILF